VRRIGRPLPLLQRRRRDLPAALTRAVDVALAPAQGDRGSLEQLRSALDEALERGLRRTRWRRGRPPAAQQRASPEDSSATMRRRARPPAAAPAYAGAPAPAPDPRRLAAGEDAGAEHERTEPARLIALPRAVWLACALALIVWQAFAGRAGVALLASAALAPLALAPGERGSSHLKAGWLGCALAPLLGLAGLAGAFPAIAGQASRWRERATLAALGYWWLALAEPLLGRRLWLGRQSGVPARAAWEGSLSVTAVHVIFPLLTLGVLLGALLWGTAAAVLPWLARGRSAALDVVLVTVWSAAIAAAAPALDAGLSAHAAHPSARGAVLGAILGGVIAVAARALRGPV